MIATLLAAASGGGVIDLRTTVAITSTEATSAYAAAFDIEPGFKSAGRGVTKHEIKQSDTWRMRAVAKLGEDCSCRSRRGA